jgi:hypothetical protein
VHSVNKIGIDAIYDDLANVGLVGRNCQASNCRRSPADAVVETNQAVVSGAGKQDVLIEKADPDVVDVGDAERGVEIAPGSAIKRQIPPLLADK